MTLSLPRIIADNFFFALKNEKIFIAGKNLVAAKFSDYETGYYHFQAKL